MNFFLQYVNFLAKLFCKVIHISNYDVWTDKNKTNYWSRELKFVMSSRTHNISKNLFESIFFFVVYRSLSSMTMKTAFSVLSSREFDRLLLQSPRDFTLQSFEVNFAALTKTKFSFSEIIEAYYFTQFSISCRPKSLWLFKIHLDTFLSCIQYS